MVLAYHVGNIEKIIEMFVDGHDVVNKGRKVSSKGRSCRAAGERTCRQAPCWAARSLWGAAAMKVLTPASAISPGGLLADYFVGSSWDRWRAVLKAAYAERMSPRELELFHEVAEREPPMAPVQELWAIAGRGGGKDAIASAIATVAALGHNDFLRPGEVGTIFCLATDRVQAKIAHRYVSAYFRENEHLAPLVMRETDEVIELCNRIEIVTAANSFRSIRGRSVIFAVSRG